MSVNTKSNDYYKKLFCNLLNISFFWGGDVGAKEDLLLRKFNAMKLGRILFVEYKSSILRLCSVFLMDVEHQRLFRPLSGNGNLCRLLKLSY